MKCIGWVIRTFLTLTVLANFESILAYYDLDKVWLRYPDVLGFLSLENSQNWTFFALGCMSVSWGYWIVGFNSVQSRMAKFLTKVRTRYVELRSGLRWVESPKSVHSFGYIISRPHSLCLVEHIHLRATNLRSKEVVIIAAYIRSLVTGEKIEMALGQQRIPSGANGVRISPEATFDLYAIFPNESGHQAGDQIKGLSLPLFWRRFSSFEIIMETRDFKIREEISVDDTQLWISSVWMGLMMPPPGEKAAVLPAE